MAHLKKFGKGAVGNMMSHYERSSEEKIGNPDVDHSMSHLNYNLAFKNQPLPQVEFLQKRLGEVKVQNRKDINVFCSWVLTAPSDLPKSDEKKFFEDSYSFMQKRYGAENVISAHVHNDETTPHLHFSFIPITEDLKKGGYKLSAKEVCTRKDLQTFHQDLSAHLQNTFGRDVGVLNSATENGNKSIKELKQKQYDEITQLERQKEEIQAKIDDLKKIDLDMAEIEKIQPKPFLGAIKGVSVDDVEDLKLLAKQKYVLERENKVLKNENIKLKQQVPTVEQKLENSRKFAKLANLEKLVDSIPKEQLEKLNQKSNLQNNER